MPGSQSSVCVLNPLTLFNKRIASDPKISVPHEEPKAHFRYTDLGVNVTDCSAACGLVMTGGPCAELAHVSAHSSSRYDCSWRAMSEDSTENCRTDSLTSSSDIFPITVQKNCPAVDFNTPWWFLGGAVLNVEALKPKIVCVRVCGSTPMLKGRIMSMEASASSPN